ncbi:MAG: aminotransferase class I/II-fold pyridoxal phosphate-dependent enzyme, partial [Cytophagales bacterium]|nr:aminotransferase class I/II-fold pyridoxal phosphate-dependent enzyme [Cytophagales bacterium]
HQSESALLFNSGYSACFGVLSTIPQKGDTIIYDELSHACIKDGARLSHADKYSFKHNDLDDLNRKLSIGSGNKFVVVESIYSMDGDMAPLKDIVAVVQNYGAHLIIDEAHSTGIVGRRGAGLSVELGIEKDVFVRIHTFGKAMGVHGACVAASQLVRDYLINFCRPFIYTTALSPHSIVSIHQSYIYLQNHDGVQNDLKEKIRTFLTRIPSELNSIVSTSPIQAVLIPGNTNVKKVANGLQANGFDIRPILSPTVPLGKERLRISLHVHNSKTEILGMVDLLNQLI